MPITVACSCGKKMQVPDRMAGKAGRCPGCGGTVRIPGGSGVGAGEGAGGNGIVLSCSCGKKMKVQAHLAGKRVKCPGCGTPLTVGGGGGGGPTRASAPPAPKRPAGSSAPARPKSASRPSAPAGGKPASKGAVPDKGGKALHNHNYCPNCNTFVSRSDAICVECGTNLKTGKKLPQTKTESEPGGWQQNPIVVASLVGGLLLLLGFCMWFFVFRS